MLNKCFLDETPSFRNEKASDVITKLVGVRVPSPSLAKEGEHKRPQHLGSFALPVPEGENEE